MGGDAMAKASTGGTTSGKMKSAPRAAAGKKPKVAAVAPKVKAAAGKVVASPAAPKMAPASRKAPAKGGPPKRASAKGKAAAKQPVPKKTAVKAATKQKAAPRLAAPGKAGAKTVAVKIAAGRRPAVRTAVPTPTARRARSVAAPRKAPAAARQAPVRPASADAVTDKRNAPQTFTVSHLNQQDFKADGLRTYAQYRDLGIAAASGGLCQAHVIRFNPPCTDEVRKQHVHDVDLQLVYVLQGWMKNEFEGHGEQMMSAGSCWLQPSGIRHTVLDYSPDCEVLEIIVPADFKTEEL